ncbi:hypothetical protein [Acinetobacter sp. YH12069]|uniref:hypothetical protein n=1 Tax=Acinetobacter sp. YH12069 TaxID=2601065 RepID=UPI00211DA95C|nr:hypothetical protein [Acinetobacter sp. YH12069]
MNELLQQRIESVQAGRNITHAQLEAKRSLREQLDSDLEAFLKNGGAVEQLPQGFSGECSKGWNGSKPKSQKTMRQVMANSVVQTDKKRARQKEDQAALAEIKVLSEWCKARKGRGGELCKHIGVAHGFISQITNQVRPCSKERYEQIKLAMKTIEQREQAA